jgi:hypothetical protein
MMKGVYGLIGQVLLAISAYLIAPDIFFVRGLAAALIASVAVRLIATEVSNSTNARSEAGEKI